MYFNIASRALVLASLFSLFLAVCASPIAPFEDTEALAARQLKQFDIRSPTKVNMNRRAGPSSVPK